MPDAQGKIRYAVVGGGWISQGAFMPGVGQTDNSVITALVTGDPIKADKLAELYPQGGDVTVVDLVAKGAVRKNEKVKVLGTGDISVALNVSVDKVSGSAEQKIVAAGGSIN